MSTPAPPAPPPITNKTPPPRSAPPPQNGNGAPPRPGARKFGVSSGVVNGPQKVGIFGTGGIGKTELASLLASQGIVPLFVDIGDGSQHRPVKRVEPTPETWEELRDVLHNKALLEPYGAIVIDDMTKAEEMASVHVVQTIPDSAGKKVGNIEAYGFGKGLTHIYDTFLTLFQDLDAVARSGKWVVCIAHECTSTVPNPHGEDYLRYEPRLQSPASGKNSIRHRFKEWADHLFFIGYDVHVDKQVGTGVGTRTIYTEERPHCLAKTRTLSGTIPYDRGSDLLWSKLVKGENS